MLVDPGWNAPEALAALTEGLAVAGARVEDVRGVLVTHIHPDHYGLAARIRERSGAWVGLHPADAALVPDRYRDVDDLLERTSRWVGQTGAPAPSWPSCATPAWPCAASWSPGSPTSCWPTATGRRCPAGGCGRCTPPGHTPGHLCFVEERTGVVLTGDHVLPTISPNISRHPQAGPDPLADYLASLERLRPYGDALVLPGHQRRFRGLAGRLDELAAHHEARLDEAQALVAAGAATIWEVATRLGWSRPWAEITGIMRRAALGETAAHLTHLERRGRLERAGDTPLRWVVRGSPSPS